MCRVTVMPRGDEWTVADLASLPDDGLQYELADGVLLVSPAAAAEAPGGDRGAVPAPAGGLSS